MIPIFFNQYSTQTSTKAKCKNTNKQYIQLSLHSFLFHVLIQNVLKNCELLHWLTFQGLVALLNSFLSVVSEEGESFS